MNKYYKNVTDRQIRTTLYGVGEVNVPANAACVELEPGVAEALNQMVYPEIILVEVTPRFTVDDNPVVDAETMEEPDEPDVLDVAPLEEPAPVEEKKTRHRTSPTLAIETE